MSTKSPIRIAFFGTPKEACSSLAALINDDRFEVACIVTQPDKPAGRKRILTPPPIKEYAEQCSIPVLQPASVKASSEEGQAFLKELTSYDCDVFVLIAYGKILPAELLEMTPHGIVNIHPSALPLFRGPSPVQATILSGATDTAVTIMRIDEGMDSGPMLEQIPYQLSGTETTATLLETLFELGAEALPNTLFDYIQGDITPQEQDHDKATICSLIKKEDALIDWNDSPEQIDRMIRAYTPWPIAYTDIYNGKRIKIQKAALIDGKLVPMTVQPEGKRPMTYADYIAGNPDQPLPPIRK